MATTEDKLNIARRALFRIRTEQLDIAAAKKIATTAMAEINSITVVDSFKNGPAPLGLLLKEDE